MEKINAEIIKIEEIEKPRKIIQKIKRHLYKNFNINFYTVTLKDEKWKIHSIIVDDDELYILWGDLERLYDNIYWKRVTIYNDGSWEYIVEE